MIETERVCEHCGKINTITHLSVQKEWCTCEQTEEKAKLIYQRCEGCKEPMILQVDDSETIEISRKEKELMLKAIKKRAKKQTVSPKDMRKREKLDKELKRKREDLKEHFEGKTFLQDDGKILCERLTILRKDAIIDCKV